MREIPILFNGPMVRAIPDGHKTQTRRVVKAPRCTRLHGRHPQWDRMYPDSSYAHLHYTGGDMRDDSPSVRVFCPYGERGDLLYVREAWRWDHSENDVTYRADDSARRFLSAEADEWSRLDWQRPHRHAQWNSRWRPSIHMPKWAARIWLRVTGVRVERIQEITDNDARAEGCESSTMPGYWSCLGWDGGSWSQTDEPKENREQAPDVFGGGVKAYVRVDEHELMPVRRIFTFLWNSLNEKRGFGWDVNPWVWVVEFERHG